ncbi:MAG: ATP phosphoribosyltransferase regulatory subunit, partial [Clostridia bacterium]|nr:ATP phosphoribosyltransferase regulatory subunit [Clostridia bacterium]
MINIPKGTKDVLPAESYKWHYVENIARETAATFCLSEIRTPTFEHTELFLRGVGETTDVVNKEMYTFLDKGDRSMTLKPEGTAGVARSFIENGLYNGAMPLKTYYITPVFRYENPQKGRLREHHQFGVEVYGGAGADTDAEVIVLANTLLKKLGLSVSLRINSMGCSACRAEYNKALK